MATLIDLEQKCEQLFHELSPRERMNTMRNTMGKVSRDIRRMAVNDLKSLSYSTKPRYKKGPAGRGNAKALRRNIVLTVYRRAVGFNVSVLSRKAKKGGKTAVDHTNRWGRNVPAAFWLNHGTKRQPARPFLTNAQRSASESSVKVRDVFRQKITDMVKKHNARVKV